MKPWHLSFAAAHLRAAVILSLLTGFGVVHAQPYRCVSGSATYFSDRPCPAAQPSNTLRAIGPVRSVPYSQPMPSVSKAQEHIKYLGPECASISEAIRTGPSRGVRQDTLRSLHDEYRAKCSVEDEEARKQVGQEQAERRRTQVAQRESTKIQRQQEEVRSAQCLGMRDAISARRKKEPELTDKEVESLRSLERSYNERCLAK